MASPVLRRLVPDADRPRGDRFLPAGHAPDRTPYLAGRPLPGAPPPAAARDRTDRGFYNIGFFTILAAGPFALPNAGIIQIGWIYFGWGLLLAVVSVFVAPVVQRAIGTVPAILVTLALFGLDLAVMAVRRPPAGRGRRDRAVGRIDRQQQHPDHRGRDGRGTGRAPGRVGGVLLRPLLRRCHRPHVALKLFGAPPDVHVHAPFWFGAAMVGVGLVILACGARLLTRTLAQHHETRLEEAEAILVGDLD